MDWTQTLAPDVDDAAATDEELREAFVEFVEKHREQVYRVARQMMGRHEDADDVVQETFLRAYRSLKRFRREAAVPTWLYRIAMNVALNQLRQQRRRKRFLGLLGRRGGIEQRTPRLPSAIVEADETRVRIQEAIASLPPAQRAVVVLFDLEGLRCAEIADILDVPEGTVRSRLHHARKHLRSRLEPYLFGTKES